MRRRIMLLTGGLTALVILAFVIPLAILVRNSVRQHALSGATSDAAAVAIFLRSVPPTDAAVLSYLTSLEHDGGRVTCVQAPDGQILGTKPPGGIPSDMPTNGGDGDGDGADHKYNDAEFAHTGDGDVATVSVGTTAGVYVVRTYLPDKDYEDSVHSWWLLLGASSVVLFALSLIGAEIVTRRIVRPLVRTADTAHRISAGDLGARAPEQGPVEVAQVGVAMNRLADRIGELIIEERETVADLSHRLRTPLTALRLDVDGLRDRDDAERIGDHVTAIERSLTNIIKSARRPRSDALIPRCDAASVVAERAAFWAPLAEDQNRTMTVDIAPGPHEVRLGDEELGAAVDALLENVIAHTPEGSALAVRLGVGPSGSGAVLDVQDSGPGIPPTAVLRGLSDRGSTGLGLSIARRCAEVSGGRFEVLAGPGGIGAVVRLELGA